MRNFGTLGMDLYVLDERVARQGRDAESVPASRERRSALSVLGQTLRNGIARIR